MNNSYLTANYHSHTFRCHHAEGTEREYVEHAIDAGIKILGFSDHAPLLFSRYPGHKSGIRMQMSELDDYCRVINSLKDEYKSQIEIHLGLELEYTFHDFKEQIAIYRNAGIEYVILGQHFLGDEPEGIYNGRPTRSSEQLHRYVNQCIEGMSTGVYTYIAHPDIINYSGDDDLYASEMDRLCKAALEYDIPLEINLLGLYYVKQYPCERFFRLAAQNGNKTIFGVDAHMPEFYDNKDVLKSGRRFAESLGLHVIDTVPLKNLSDY